jgi:hypothetical protein
MGISDRRFVYWFFSIAKPTFLSYPMLSPALLGKNAGSRWFAFKK